MNEPEHLFGFADIIGVNTDNGELRITVGDVGLEKGFAGRMPYYGPDGFIGIPNLPDDEGKASQAIYFYDGNRKVYVGSRDNRFAANIGTGEPGDRMIVTDGEARVMVKQARDAVVLYTVNQLVDKSMMIDLGGAEGQLTILNGGAFIKITNDEIVLAVNGGGGIRISADGVQVTGGAFQAITGQVQLGDVGGGIAPPPVAATSGVAYTSAGPVNTISTKVFVAP